ncbi:SDR family oxidoreductase [Patescibacteria group bacterium]
MNVFGTGLNGLIGSRVVEFLENSFKFTNVSLETGIDITDSETITNLISKSPADWVFHFAAFTDIDKSEIDKKNGKNGLVWRINTEATRVICEACKKYNKKLLYISTDFVFEGNKEIYNEDDIPNPIGWYGITKYEGEKFVARLNQNGLIIRIANPYRSNWSGKADFVHRILQLLTSGNEVSAPSDQIFTPTFIDDIAAAIKILTKNDASGIFHITGSKALSPYEAIVDICRVFKLDFQKINKDTYTNFWKGRAPRPFYANLKSVKIKKFGITMKSFTEGLEIIKLQESS